MKLAPFDWNFFKYLASYILNGKIYSGDLLDTYYQAYLMGANGEKYG